MKRFFLLLCICAVSIPVQAQISINLNHFPQIGDTIPLLSLSPGEIPNGSILVPGDSGANRTWNFVNLGINPDTISFGGETYVVRSPVGTRFDSLFPGSSVALHARIPLFGLMKSPSNFFKYLKLNSVKLQETSLLSTTPSEFGGVEDTADLCLYFQYMGDSAFFVYRGVGAYFVIPGFDTVKFWTIVRNFELTLPITFTSLINLQYTYEFFLQTGHNPPSKFSGGLVIQRLSFDSWGTVFTQLGMFPCLRLSFHSTQYDTMYPRGKVDTFHTRSYEWWTQRYSIFGVFGLQYDTTDTGWTLSGVSMVRRPPAIVSVSDQKYLPTGFLLHQNFPNPFNPATTIRYEIPRASHVTLRIYSVLGQEVATLVKGEIPAGVYGVQLDATHLPSGVYYYQLQANGFVQTRKLILLR